MLAYKYLHILTNKIARHVKTAQVEKWNLATPQCVPLISPQW
jgi:hypothetical protein